MDNSVDLQVLLQTADRPPHVREISKQISEEARLEAILENARDHAIAKGMESRMKTIRATVASEERNLDAIYNFAPLMIHDRVVPPVITEAKDIVQNPDTLTLKTTGVLYKIQKQAQFSTVAPNWREYLTFPVTQYEVAFDETPTREMMPRTSAEKAKWQQVTIKSFKDGMDQADSILKHSLNKLNTDYNGMIRFHEFVIAGKITMPSIVNRDLAIASTNSAMALDQRLLTIRTLPAFEGNMTKWSTWITPVQYDPSGKPVTINKVD